MTTDAERQELTKLADSLERALRNPHALRAIRKAVLSVGRSRLKMREELWRWRTERKKHQQAAVKNKSWRNPDRRPKGCEGWVLEDHFDLELTRLESGEVRKQGLGEIRVWMPPEYLKSNRPPAPVVFADFGERDWNVHPLTDDERLTLAAIIHDCEYADLGINHLVDPWGADESLDTDDCPIYPIEWPRRDLHRRWWARCVRSLQQDPLSHGDHRRLRHAADWAVEYLQELGGRSDSRMGAAPGNTKAVTPTVPFPVQPKPVREAIDALNRITKHALCVRHDINERQRMDWDWDRPMRLPEPVPSLDDYLASKRESVEESLTLTWDEDLERCARIEHVDHCELYEEIVRKRRHAEDQRNAALQHWADLMAAIPEAQSAMKAIKPYLGVVVEHPGAWLTEALQALGHLAVLRQRWGERPWVGEPKDLQGPLSDLLQRMSLLQSGDFTVQTDSGGNPENNAGDDGRSGSDSTQTQQYVVLWEGAEYSERAVRLARTRTAYMEAHGKVSEALKALEVSGHKIGRSTFYNHLDTLDKECPNWRESVLRPTKLDKSDCMDNTLIARTRKKTRDQLW